MKQSPPPKYSGLVHFRHAAAWSWAGLRAAWRHEAAFRQEVVLTAVLVPLGLYLGANTIDRVLLVAPCFIVLVVELLNTAVEAVVDMVSPDHHPLAGRAKDLGSAAVLVSLVLLALIWVIVLMPVS